MAQKTSKIAIAVLLLLLLFGGGIWLVAIRGGGDGGGGRQVARDPAALASGAAAWRARDGGALALPAWLAQRGLAPRRIGGVARDRGARCSECILVLLSIRSSVVEPAVFVYSRQGRRIDLVRDASRL